MTSNQTPNCPNCGKPMILRHRRSDNKPFYGCSGFPRCKGIVNVGQAQTTRQEEDFSKFNWTKYQKDIFNFVETGTGNATVEAVAGSGKTTTILAALSYTPANAKVAFVAFNKRIADELAQRAPARVSVRTLHSLGMKNVRSVIKSLKVQESKNYQIFKGMLSNQELSDTFKAKIKNSYSDIANLVSLLKATLLEPTAANLEYLSDRYGINLNGSQAEIFAAATEMFANSIKMAKDGIIDFDDMIYLPAVGIAPCEKFDIFFVDEAQDLNKAQIQFVLNSMADGGRVIAVGDRAQSIYGFRGADTEAIPNLIAALDATTLPLSTCYRCPKSHIELAKDLVPQIEAAPNAIDGYVGQIKFSELVEHTEPGDLVMCRTNAPLVKPAFELIRRGIKAIILGRDIGKGLTDLVNKISKVERINTLAELLYSLAEYRDREVSKLIAAKKNTRAANLEDQVETIVNLAWGAETIEDLLKRIDTVFSDTVEGVVFSSIHKAKGTQADRTFILRPDLMPHPMAKNDWEMDQELNIKYVALTRAKKEMYFVQGEF